MKDLKEFCIPHQTQALGHEHNLVNLERREREVKRRHRFIECELRTKGKHAELTVSAACSASGAVARRRPTTQLSTQPPLRHSPS